MSKKVDQTLAPMRNFIIGGSGPQTQPFHLNSLSEQPRGEPTVGIVPPAKVTGLSASLDTSKISGHVSPPRSPLRDPQVEQSLYTLRKNTSPSIELAKQSTLVDSLTPHDNLEQTKQDSPFVPPSQIPSAPTAVTTVPRYQDCPRIDLVTLVREKQKAKKLQKKKLTAPSPQKERRRRVIPKGLNYEKSR